MKLFDITTEYLPHVTWITAGSLSHLPIHAAGMYQGNVSVGVDDFVVSSYAPSLTVMLDALGRSTRSMDTRHNLQQLLAVAQPQTPHQAQLPGTIDEVIVIQKYIPGISRLEGPDATRETVLHKMNIFPWVHLACHGVQDARDPIQSAFLLEDGPLSLADLLKASFEHTQLAFLSACQSAAGDAGIPEEAFHLASGMLAAGYSSVVGTMWSIHDQDAPFVAEEFYRYLMDDSGGDVRRSAYALHHAVTKLRQRIGDDAINRWAPYIHVGV